jgi:hypothetical protein
MDLGKTSHVHIQDTVPSTQTHANRSLTQVCATCDPASQLLLLQSPVADPGFCGSVEMLGTVLWGPASGALHVGMFALSVELLASLQGRSSLLGRPVPGVDSLLGSVVPGAQTSETRVITSCQHIMIVAGIEEAYGVGRCVQGWC